MDSERSLTALVRLRNENERNEKDDERPVEVRQLGVRRRSDRLPAAPSSTLIGRSRQGDEATV